MVFNYRVKKMFINAFRYPFLWHVSSYVPLIWVIVSNMRILFGLI